MQVAVFPKKDEILNLSLTDFTLVEGGTEKPLRHQTTEVYVGSKRADGFFLGQQFGAQAHAIILCVHGILGGRGARCDTSLLRCLLRILPSQKRHVKQCGTEKQGRQ